MTSQFRVGNAPCSWGVEFADDLRNPNWSSVLDECAAAGYDGIDLGPFGFLPEDPDILKDELDKRNLKLTSGVLFKPFHDSRKKADCFEAAHHTCKTLQALDAQQLVIIDSISPERVNTLGRPNDAPRLKNSDWKGFSNRIKETAKIANQEYGLTASIHSHAGGYCDFEDELRRLLEEVDNSLLKICIDTAHMTLAGMDPLKMVNEYHDRLAHIHLKDIDPIKKKLVVSEGIQFYTACADNLFCQMGEGEVEFNLLRQLLQRIEFDGWCTVEQDCAPDAKTSKVQVARANRAFLKSVGF